MATATLPYPDMDFTPLDILTAAEMDQMVANDQYLTNFVNGLADGSNLSDGVIQARSLADNLTSYSLSEQDTGFAWTNGKHIYKKTFVFNALSNASSVSVNHEISGLDTVVDFSCMIYGSNSRWMVLNMPAGNTATQWNIVEIDSGRVYIYSGSDQRGSKAWVTLYYTKN